MSFLRARQPAITRVFPHNANRKYIVAGRQSTQQFIEANRPIMGVVAAQANTQLIAIAPVDMKPFLTQGADPITWSAANLPTGLTISSTTGIVSGTAPAAAVFSTCTITATNEFGADTSVAFVWTISI